MIALEYPCNVGGSRIIRFHVQILVEIKTVLGHFFPMSMPIRKD